MNLYKISFGSEVTFDYVVAESYANAEDVYLRYFPDNKIKEISFISSSVYVQGEK